MEVEVVVPDNEHEIMRAIGRLEGKVDSLIADAGVDGKVQASHEKRIAVLEKKQYGIFLVGGLIGAIFLATIRSIVRFFTGN